MLDVHPAHHAANSWRDFFIHIATIVVGLLIAVGLEQTVEFFHHRHQVTDARETLRREHDINVKLYALKAEEFRRFTPILQKNLAIFLYLQQHPGAPQENLPGKLHWFNLNIYHVESAWKSAQQSNVLELMPPQEVQRYTELYRRMADITTTATDLRAALYEARSFTQIDPDPSHLSPAAISRQIELMNKLLLSQVLTGAAQISLARRFTEFSSASTDDITQITHISTEQEANSELSALQKRFNDILAEDPESSTGEK